MELQIEKNVPIPIGNHSKKAYSNTFRKMEIGDSFFIASFTETIRRSLGVCANNAGVKIKTRMGNQGLRVWRIE